MEQLWYVVIEKRTTAIKAIFNNMIEAESYYEDCNGAAENLLFTASAQIGGEAVHIQLRDCVYA